MTARPDALLAAINTPNLASAACRGRHELYDSHDPSDVASAQRICAGCPALQACKQWVETSPQRLHGYVVAGQVQRRTKPHKHKPSVPPVSRRYAAAMAALEAWEAKAHARKHRDQC